MNIIKAYLAKRKAKKLGQVGKTRHKETPEAIIILDNSRVITIFLLILVWIVTTYALSLPSLQVVSYRLVVGQQAPQTIYAREKFNYIDTSTYNQQLKNIADSEPVCFTVNLDDNLKIIARFDQFIAELKDKAKDDNYQIKDEKLRELFDSLTPTLQSELLLIAGASEIVNSYKQELNSVLSQGVISNSERGEFLVSQMVRVLDGENRDRMPKAIEMIPTPSTAAKQATLAVLRQFPIGKDKEQLQEAMNTLTKDIIGSGGNLHLDQQRTNLRISEAQNLLVPETIEIKKSEPIIIKDNLVDAVAKDKLKAYELHLQETMSNRIVLHKILENALFSLILLFFMFVNVVTIKPSLGKNNRSISLIAAVILITIGLNFCAIKAFGFLCAFLNIPPDFIGLALPIALPAVVIVMILGVESAIFASLFIAGVSALMLNTTPELIFPSVIFYATTAILAALGVKSVSNYRLYSIRIVLVVFALLLGLQTIFLLFESKLTSEDMTHIAIICTSNALFTAITALILVFIFEIVFNVSTNMSLLIQSDINHPLLKELHLKAPGTYFHVQTVATLAEAAAKAIGANYLKCRVGALYHDIGKLKKPEYFAENNIGKSNMHEDLTPAMSAIIIRAHVDDGVEIARQNKLSQLVKDMIQQHHGTDIMRFFYNKALTQANGANVLESQYSYAGERPKTKEVAIVSLADACEAASRSLAHPTMQNITVMVKSIFNSRLEAGQLNDSELTMADLAKIQDSIILTLTTMYHSRIAYPEKQGESSSETKLPLENNKTSEAK